MNDFERQRTIKGLKFFGCLSCSSLLLLGIFASVGFGTFLKRLPDKIAQARQQQQQQQQQATAAKPQDAQRNRQSAAGATPATPAKRPAQRLAIQGTTATRTGDSDPRLATNLVIVFDGSGSMNGQRIAEAKSSVNRIFDQVPASWNVGIVAFDRNGIRELLPLAQHDPAAVRAQVATLQAGGSTPLGAAIRKATDMLVAVKPRQQGYGRYRVLVVTDGEASDADAVEPACRALAKQGFTLDTIGFHLAGRHALQKWSLSYREAGNADQLDAALSESLAEEPATE